MRRGWVLPVGSSRSYVFDGVAAIPEFEFQVPARSSFVIDFSDPFPKVS